MDAELYDFDDFIARLLRCIEAHAGGRNETTRTRREAILLFVDRCAVYHVETVLTGSNVLEDLSKQMVHFSLALDHIIANGPQDDPLVEAIRGELMSVLTILFGAADRVVADQDEMAQLQTAHTALQSIFDWISGRYLRAYIYTLTNELVPDGLLGNERHQMNEAIRECIEEIRNDS